LWAEICSRLTKKILSDIAGYDHGIGSCTLQQHANRLESLMCSVIKLDGADSLEKNAEIIIKAYKRKPARQRIIRLYGDCMKNREQLLEKVQTLVLEYRRGALGGERMPEDENPHLAEASRQNYMYFTLPMALNYQRNSYVLWECANRMYRNAEARKVFDSKKVCAMPEEDLRKFLVEYKVALQPNKQPPIWKRICRTIEEQLDGDIRNLFLINNYSVRKIKEYIRDNKQSFPYLGGNKICNYWLYVLEQYTDIEFADRENITVAPDTHVRQASQRLGIISAEEARSSAAQALLAQRWAELLDGTGLVPIDVHTPLWLWSRSGFTLDI